MVNQAPFLAAGLLCGQLIDRLPPVARARVLLALLGLVVLGLLMVLCVALGGRYVRRLSRMGVSRTRPGDDLWHRRPLATDTDTRDDRAG